MATLVFLKEGTPGIRFPLKRGRVTIGRGPDCEITIEGSKVSRVHAVIAYDGGFFEITDQSKNGTQLNGKPVRKARLETGALIQIGDWRLRFEAGESEVKETVTVTAAAQREIAPDSGPGGLIGGSKPMQKLFELIRKLADSPATVLISGETGTGKELIANALHQLSKRELLPFVPINCASISPTLMESELFGHEKGSFTGAGERHTGAFEHAGGGTIFLDEIGEMSLDLQAKLLRTLEAQKIRRVGGNQEIPVACRMIAATHRNLTQWVKQGKFREDLYYRLYVMPVEVPPLRQRRNDIPLLAEFFLRQMRPESTPRLSKAAIRKLTDHLWPGNVRELKNVILRATLLSEEAVIDAQELILLPQPVGEDRQEPRTLQEMEKGMILEKLRENGWNKAAAARALGIASSTIFKKIEEYGLKES